jgi:hypothetical protein
MNARNERLIFGAFVNSPLNKLETFNLFLSYDRNHIVTDNVVKELKLSYKTDIWLVDHV